MPIGIPLTAVWLYDDSAAAYVNDTIEAQTDGGTAFELMAETADYMYFGFSRRIDALMYVLAISGTYGALTWSYGASISSWPQFVPLDDGEFEASPQFMLWDHRGSTIDAAWTSFALTTAAPHTVGSVPDSTARFWIRVTAASITTAATADSIVCRPYVTYATPADVQAQLQLSTAFSASSNPSLFTIEDMIRGVEDHLVYTMGESWRVEFESDEDLNFGQYGMKMRYQPIITPYSLSVWNGSQYDVKVEGREKDFFVDLRLGFVYLSTIFLDAVPPQMRRSYSARRDQGAFKRAVRVTYSHGHDIRRHKLAVKLRRIATYKACMDVVTDLDWAPLIPLGLDTINLQTKYENWSKEYDAFLAQFAKTRVA